MRPKKFDIDIAIEYSNKKLEQFTTLHQLKEQEQNNTLSRSLYIISILLTLGMASLSVFMSYYTISTTTVSNIMNSQYSILMDLPYKTPNNATEIIFNNTVNNINNAGNALTNINSSMRSIGSGALIMSVLILIMLMLLVFLDKSYDKKKKIASDQIINYSEILTILYIIKVETGRYIRDSNEIKVLSQFYINSDMYKKNIKRIADKILKKKIKP